MPSPQATDPKLEKMNSWIQKIWDWLVDLAIKVLAGKFPYLNIPPLSWVFSWIVKRNLRNVSIYIKQVATESVIDRQTKDQVEHAEKARDTLKDELNKKVRDPEALRKANEEFNKRYADLIHYDGHASNVD